MTVLLAAPYNPPSAPPDLWRGCSQTWTGWDGSVWRVSGDPDSGVRLKAGVRGLSMPPWQRYTSKSPAVAGSRWRGAIADEREVFWPLAVYSDQSSDAWIAYDRAFWRTLHPELPGVWTFVQPDGSIRRMRLRFVDDGQHAFRTDPSRLGWTTYGITLVAEQPFWEGEPIVRSWKAADPVPFFGAGAPSFGISSGSTLANATLDNPGDEAAWLEWTVTGPTTSVSVGVSGRVVEVPFALAAGEPLVINTSPTAQTAITGAGVERTADLGAVDFAPIAPGESVPLSLSMVGSGIISASLVPLWHRAW